MDSSSEKHLRGNSDSNPVANAGVSTIQDIQKTGFMPGAEDLLRIDRNPEGLPARLDRLLDARQGLII